MVEKQKAEAVAAKKRGNRGGISFSIEGNENYSDTDDRDPDQADDLNPIECCNDAVTSFSTASVSSNGPSSPRF